MGYFGHGPIMHEKCFEVPYLEGKIRSKTNMTQQGFTLWFTGLSGSGKSTLATYLLADPPERGKRVEILDGDEVRENLSKGLGFSKEDRDTNIRRIGFVANLLARNGVWR